MSSLEETSFYSKLDVGVREWTAATRMGPADGASVQPH
jgi:hypothetical protein